MHCFYCETMARGAERVQLPPEESRHLSRVLRLEAGDEVTLLNGRGLWGRAQVEEVSRRGDEVCCRVLELLDMPRPVPSIRLYIAPPKGKNMDLLLKEATELGVGRITPILCKYAVAKPEGCKEGWFNTLVTACKQSRNPWLPQVDEPLGFLQALAQAGEIAFLGAVPREGSETPTLDRAAMAKRGIGLWVGPEGGFSPEEEEALLAAAAYPLTLGSYILRVETAVPALLGALHCLVSQ